MRSSATRARTPTAAALADQLEQVVQVASGETLAAWAARELEADRVKHREWLAGVVAANRRRACRVR